MFLFCLNCYTVNASIEVEVKFKKKKWREGGWKGERGGGSGGSGGERKNRLEH